MKEKDIREDYVKSIDELKEGIMLGVIGIHYYNLFKKASEKINNDSAIIRFWNNLVEYNKYAKSIDKCVNISSAVAGTAIGTVMAKIGSNYSDLLTCALLVAEAAPFAGVTLATYANKQEKLMCAMELEGLRVLYPDLYDIELIFNKVPYVQISEGYKQDFSTDRYVGKQIYKKAHEEYEKYLAENKGKKFEELLNPEDFVKKVELDDKEM